MGGIYLCVNSGNWYNQITGWGPRKWSDYILSENKCRDWISINDPKKNPKFLKVKNGGTACSEAQIKTETHKRAASAAAKLLEGNCWPPIFINRLPSGENMAHLQWRCCLNSFETLKMKAALEPALDGISLVCFKSSVAVSQQTASTRCLFSKSLISFCKAAAILPNMCYTHQECASKKYCWK